WMCGAKLIEDALPWGPAAPERMGGRGQLLQPFQPRRRDVVERARPADAVVGRVDGEPVEAPRRDALGAVDLRGVQRVPARLLRLAGRLAGDDARGLRLPDVVAVQQAVHLVVVLPFRQPPLVLAPVVALDQVER